MRALAAIATLAMLALPLAISFLVTPEDIESGRIVLSPPCAFRRVFGRPCPTCGLTRGFAALSHGRLALATQYNPLTVPVYGAFWLGSIAALVLGARSALSLRAMRSLPSTEESR